MLARVARASLSTKTLVEKYAKKTPPFGFNGLGEFVFNRTYARTIVDEVTGKERMEQWHEAIGRVVQGTSDMLEYHGQKPLDDNVKEDMYDAMFNMRFLPPGRGLWAMGTAITRERHLYAALNNCAFISTENIKDDPAAPFCFLLDASMLGIGVGFDTKGADQVEVPIITNNAIVNCKVADSREGWVDAYRTLIRHYLCNGRLPVFDFSDVRAAGMPIKGFGGVSGGPKPLIDLIETTTEVFEERRGKKVGVRTIVDLMNLIGQAVISGNVRRTAEIAFGEPTSDEFLNLKNYKLNPERSAYGWTSNNSVFATVGMDYSAIAHRIRDNGEPGCIWLDNMRNYSRMCDAPDFKDARAGGSNPCVEQTLESGELCCLVETFPNNCADIIEWKDTLELAFLYAKIVTLGETPWSATNRVMKRNRRIGTSISGIAQFVANRGLDTLREWCVQGYSHLEWADVSLSRKFNVPLSIKRTSVKPSGTVSLLAGATPGVHFPVSPYYVRRVRVPYANPLLERIVAAGYHIEPDVNDANTAVISFPVYVGHEKVPNLKKVSIWEQFAMAAFMQEHWADNSVSCTVTFNPETEGHMIESCLNHYQYKLKGISILPGGSGVFAQMPYEPITRAKYEEMCRHISAPLSFASVVNNEPHVSEYCDGESCTRT